MGLHLGPAGLATAGDAHPYRVSREAPAGKPVIKEVFHEAFAFMLVVHPHTVVCHQISLVRGWHRVDALIAAGEQAQAEAGARRHAVECRLVGDQSR